MDADAHERLEACTARLEALEILFGALIMAVMSEGLLDDENFTDGLRRTEDDDRRRNGHEERLRVFRYVRTMAEDGVAWRKQHRPGPSD